MASGGENTPQKKNESIHIGTCCRLCKSTDEIHFKNLFEEANRSLLITAEDILGKSLEKGELPHLLCGSCEWQLDNFRSFKATIKEAQSSFERVKMSVEVSPLVRRPTRKSSTDSEKRCSYRRSLCFDSSSMEKVRNSSGFQNLLCYFYHFCSSAFLLKLVLSITDQDKFLRIEVIKFKFISQRVATTLTAYPRLPSILKDFLRKIR